jgi:long-chain acyl-CoA synthetase
MVWAKEQGFPETKYEEVIKNHHAVVKETILKQMAENGKKEKLKGFEQIINVHIVYEGLNDLKQGFSVENDCLTPTFKLKRPQLKERFKKEIADMYKEIAARAPAATV